MITDRDIQRDFGRIMNLLKRQYTTQDKDSEEDQGCTHKQGIVIGFIHKQTKDGNDVFQKDIEKEFSMRRSTATGILQLMEKNGLILREALKDDARMKKIVLTDKANMFMNSIIQQSDEITKRALDGVTDEEKKVLKNILDKVIANLEEQK